MDKPITVAELIARLQEFPGDTRVYTEGCDCTGPCDGARLDGPYRPGLRPTVVLTRDDAIREDD